MRFYSITFLITLLNLLQAQSVTNGFKVSVQDKKFNAYYFFTPQKVSGSGNGLPINILMDPKGDIVYYKKFPRGPYSGSFRIQCNGLISYQFENKFFLMDNTFT